MNITKEARLLVQAVYPSKDVLFLKMLEVCKGQELAIHHVYQREVDACCVLQFQVVGLWNRLVKLEAVLKEMAESIEGQLYWQRLVEVNDDLVYLPYIVQVQTLLDTNVVSILLEFFTAKNIKLKEVILDPYIQSKTAISMQNLSLSVYLPVDTNLPELRENLMILCEQYNFDVIFEQDRG